MGTKYKVNEEFFDAWKPQMAYLLGYLYADGNLEDASYIRGKYVRVTSTDFSTVKKIKRWLESDHTIVCIPPTKTHPGKIRYLIRIGSHKLYDGLLRLGLYPNKSLTILFPAVSRDMLAHFVRGYFDGDGCVYIWRTRGKMNQLITKKLSIIFTSGSNKFLAGLCAALGQRLGLSQQKVYAGQRAFQLRYSTGDSVKIFSFLYSKPIGDLFLTRKFNIFRKYFVLRPGRIDREVQDILQGHVAN